MGPVFRHCPCLRPEGDDVRVLDYSHFSLEDVPGEVFSFERTLEELYLDANQIRDLPRPLFHCHGLRKLDLSDNEILSLPPAIASLINLEELDISKNGILEIPDNIKGCKGLLMVEASVNPLGKLPDGFTQLMNLEELYLNDTFLEYLPASFGRLSRLRILELRENHLKVLPKSMARLVELTRLDIGQNDFTELPDVLGSLPKLFELWCDGNKIGGLPSFIGNMKKLAYFDASKNKIGEISPEIKHCTCITDLTLTANRIKELPEAIGNLTNITILRLNENYLTSLPFSIGNLVNLEELVISSNDLESLPESIGLCRNLHTLIADINALRELPPEIGSCVHLKILSLRDNELLFIPDELGHLTELRVVNLSGNRLQYLPVSIAKLPSLQALWLSENQNKPLIPLQSDTDPETGQRVLTCFLLPQESYEKQTEIPGDEEESIADADRESRQQIKFASEANLEQPVCKKLLSLLEEGSFAMKNKINLPGKFSEAVQLWTFLQGRLVRAPTPYPKELKAHARHARNQALKMQELNGSISSDRRTSEEQKKQEPTKLSEGMVIGPTRGEPRVGIKEAKVLKPRTPNLSSQENGKTSHHRGQLSNDSSLTKNQPIKETNNAKTAEVGQESPKQVHDQESFGISSMDDQRYGSPDGSSQKSDQESYVEFPMIDQGTPSEDLDRKDPESQSRECDAKETLQQTIVEPEQPKDNDSMPKDHSDLHTQEKIENNMGKSIPPTYTESTPYHPRLSFLKQAEIERGYRSDHEVFAGTKDRNEDDGFLSDWEASAPRHVHRKGHGFYNAPTNFTKGGVASESCIVASRPAMLTETHQNDSRFIPNHRWTDHEAVGPLRALRTQYHGQTGCTFGSVDGWRTRSDSEQNDICELEKQDTCEKHHARPVHLISRFPEPNPSPTSIGHFYPSPRDPWLCSPAHVYPPTSLQPLSPHSRPRNPPPYHVAATMSSHQNLSRMPCPTTPVSVHQSPCSGPPPGGKSPSSISNYSCQPSEAFYNPNMGKELYPRSPGSERRMHSPMGNPSDPLANPHSPCDPYHSKYLHLPSLRIPLNTSPFSSILNVDAPPESHLQQGRQAEVHRNASYLYHSDSIEDRRALDDRLMCQSYPRVESPQLCPKSPYSKICYSAPASYNDQGYQQQCKKADMYPSPQAPHPNAAYSPYGPRFPRPQQAAHFSYTENSLDPHQQEVHGDDRRGHFAPGNGYADYRAFNMADGYPHMHMTGMVQKEMYASPYVPCDTASIPIHNCPHISGDLLNHQQRIAADYQHSASNSSMNSCYPSSGSDHAASHRSSLSHLSSRPSSFSSQCSTNTDTAVVSSQHVLPTKSNGEPTHHANALERIPKSNVPPALPPKTPPGMQSMCSSLEQPNEKPMPPALPPKPEHLQAYTDDRSSVAAYHAMVHSSKHMIVHATTEAECSADDASFRKTVVSNKSGGQTYFPGKCKSGSNNLKTPAPVHTQRSVSHDEESGKTETNTSNFTPISPAPPTSANGTEMVTTQIPAPSRMGEERNIAYQQSEQVRNGNEQTENDARNQNIPGWYYGSHKNPKMVDDMHSEADSQSMLSSRSDHYQ